MNEPVNEPRKQFELWIEFCGSKANRAPMWAMLSQVRQIAQGVIDDFPGLAVTSEFNCPGCVKAGEARPQEENALCPSLEILGTQKVMRTKNLEPPEMSPTICGPTCTAHTPEGMA